MKLTKLSNGTLINAARIIGASIKQSTKEGNRWFLTLETDVIITGKEGKEETLKKFIEVKDEADGMKILKDAELI